MNGWIDINDEQPKKGQKVDVIYKGDRKTEVTYQNGNTFKCWYRHWNGYDDELEWNYTLLKDVTYWMPIPELN